MRLLETPVVRAVRRRRYDALFARSTGGGAFRGAFSSFAEAARSAPGAAPLGYDVQAAGEMYRDRMDRVFPSDYPVLFWFRDILRTSPALAQVMDLGGHVGITYYAYRRYLAFPAGLHWTVCDVPAVTAAGEALAREEGVDALRFVTSLPPTASPDVLLASGSLQYIEPPLPDMLRSLSRPPRHLLVNKLPTHAHREFVTLQNIGITYCPYRISRRDALPAALAPLGYRLVDTWENPDLQCHVPFEADAGPVTYAGYYFRQD
jgi:putative methyltransferase (TIGR04325 family)